MILFPNDLLQRVVAIHIAITGEKDHPVCLYELPDRAIGTRYWQVYLRKRN